MVMPDISSVMILFAGYLLGLVAIRLWFTPERRKRGASRQVEVRPEARPRPKYPRYGVPQRRNPPGQTDGTNPPQQP